jgi:hypothetical protein
MADDPIKSALKLIFDGIELLQNSCGNSRRFTIDGRLVGDIGEIIAAREFDIELDAKSRAHHDAKTRDGRDVQIKATFKDRLTFTTEPVLYLGLKLSREGGHEVVFNGPGSVLMSAFGGRKDIGKRQLSFPVNRLRELSIMVLDADRVPCRTAS